MKGWIREKDVREHLIDQYILCEDTIEEQTRTFEELGFGAAYGVAATLKASIAYWTGRRKQVVEIGKRLGMDIPTLVKEEDDVPDYEPAEVRP